MIQDANTAIEVTELFPHPPALVWRALTESRLLARWLAPNDFELKRGHRFTLQMEPIPAADFDGATECEVLDFEVERRLHIRWVAGPLDTTVLWTLDQVPSGTRLRTRHEGFDPDDPVNRFAVKGMTQGWKSVVMSDLRDVLAEVASSIPGRRA